MTARRVARVLIDSPLPQLDRLFDYAVPTEIAADVQPGVRVRVPLRSAGRILDAYVIELGDADPVDRPLSDLDAVVSSTRVLTPALYALARRAADRAAGSATDILRLAIPKRMVRAEKAWLAAGAPAPPVVDDSARTWAESLLGPYPALVECLDQRGRGALDAPPEPVRLQDGVTTGTWAALLAAAAVRTLASGHSAILVVPDHRDQAQLEAALAGRAPADAIIRNDARQTSPARYAAYLRMLADAPCIVVGNRSSVYTPVHDPGLLAIWDDGDPLLAEPLSPGVHARDAALIRQELDGCAVVFAGHTRTSDVERLVGLGWVREVSAARRASPRVVLSATKEGESRGARVPSAAFAAAREALQTGPVLVQVARPGYAPVLICADCRTPARCPHCGGPLHAARRGAVPECGWCGRQATAWACPKCTSVRVRMASSGSERTADELGRAFPGIRIIVADGEHPVLTVDARPALVVATRGAEPIAEGGYRAVVLLDGDRMLQAEDLRIGESCLRWWSNAAALARPGSPVHLVGVTGSVARALATWTQPAYARAELTDRAPLRMPPTVRVAALEGGLVAVERALETLREAVSELEDEAILGPVAVDAKAGKPGVRSAASDGMFRALVRFDYAHGPRVAESLRGSVIADALRARKNPKTRAPGPAGTPWGSAPHPRLAGASHTLRVRVDVPDLDL